jgi:hypothetical protein
MGAMICEITSAQQAENVLRTLATTQQQGILIFDIAEDCTETIPLVLRRCRDCQQPSEYLGANIWGRGFEKRSTYCTHCGYALKTLACVTIAIQGTRVIETNYRP